MAKIHCPSSTQNPLKDWGNGQAFRLADMTHWRKLFGATGSGSVPTTYRYG
jgi:hypothetical protein